MFQNILVAIDGSTHSEAALKEAIDLAAATQGKLTIMTSFSADGGPTMSAWSSGVVVQQIDFIHEVRGRLARHAEGLLEQARFRVPPSVSCETLAVEGHPADDILAQIRAGEHDLVVLGSRGRGELSSVILGSVSHNVLHHSPVPVLIIRSGHELNEVESHKVG